jgi:YfiH family protein
VSASWRLEERDGILAIRSVILDAIPSLAHGFTTRRADGGDGFDAGGADPADLRSAAARRRAARALGLADEPVLLRQVHGARVVAVSAAREPEAADGAVWAEGSAAAAPAVRTADCVPVLLADAGGKAAAAVHAGWRGIAAGIVGEAVGALRRLGFHPESCRAAVGPAIGPCCYPVGDDVAEAVLAAVPVDGRAEVLSRPGPGATARLHLAGAVAMQLREAGVPAEAVSVAPWCTRCRADLFHSYRRDGEGAGRMLAVVGPRRRP